MKSSQPDRGALLLMIATVVLWGFSWVVMKSMTQFIGPFDLVIARYGFGFIVLFAALLVTRQPLKHPPFWLTLGIAALQATGFQCFCQYALTIGGGSGPVAMLAYTMPFWVVFFAWILLGDRPTRQHQVGFVFAALGLVAVIAPWQGIGTLTSSLLALAGGISWGLGVVLAKIMFQRHSPNALTLTTWQLFWGGILAWPLALWIPQQSIVWGPGLFWGVAYMAILASALGWWLWMAVVRRVSATVAGMSALGVPVLTVALAWLLLAERPTLLELLGVGLIVAGLVVINWKYAAPGADSATVSTLRPRGR